MITTTIRIPSKNLKNLTGVPTDIVLNIQSEKPLSKAQKKRFIKEYSKKSVRELSHV